MGKRIPVSPAEYVDLSLGRPPPSTIPGQRTLVSRFSALAQPTREIKYIALCADKGWKGKHEGATPSILFSACLRSSRA